jgi:hypothetical protein
MFVEKQFHDVGRIEPLWIATDQKGNQVVVPPPVPFVNEAAKDYAVMVVRALFAFTGVTRYCFITESWLLTNDAGIDLDATQRDGISEHPDRKEVVIFTAESEVSGLVLAWRPIIRPSRGKAKLGPLVIEQRDGMTVEGRMSSMLPRRGRAS